MEFEFFAPAQAELTQVVDYYNQQQDGLGEEFASEVFKAIHRILEQPHAWGKLSRRCRRCRTNRFPYGVVYQVREKCILIIAVMHLHRRPEYWMERLR